MNINTITAEDLRRMPDKEGLILQGCGGDLTEWVDGINEMLTKAGILKDGCQFENSKSFMFTPLSNTAVVINILFENILSLEISSTSLIPSTSFL